MYNKKKLNLVKKLAIAGISLIVLITGMGIGFGIGASSATSKAKTEQVKKPVEKKEESNNLNNKLVEKFVIAFYTKKELGENRNRYKPLMTTAMYTQAVNEEKQPVNQAYKGYITNQVFNSAEIYVNEKDLTAIAVVNYKNTQRTKLNSDQGALVDQPNTETIKLSFMKQGKMLLVNKIERVTLLTPTSSNQNSYVTAPTLPSSYEESRPKLSADSTNVSKPTTTTETTTKSEDKK
ncbi:hypothetical protein [Enterococcus faecalis]|uniref:hypothetical protein n=1 Tax=Enterococcus faecalis TaxID=1351 RepID=UPI000459E9CE|nr:hypothetical protein [Enterococcus faecalis]KAJ85619.1 hypothetical protein P791_1218 [Enterococcus faecalis NY9]